MRYTFLFLALLLFGITSCRKNNLDNHCQKLQTAMKNSNKDQAGEVITAFINALSDKNYTQQNLEKLVQSIAGECTIAADVVCFDCIKTLPSQSEIRISFQSGSTLITKVIDISYFPNDKMKFWNMHD